MKPFLWWSSICFWRTTWGMKQISKKNNFLQNETATLLSNKERHKKENDEIKINVEKFPIVDLQSLKLRGKIKQ